MALNNIVLLSLKRRIVLTFRISSRSSLKASATDAIQNFLNLSFKICSFCASLSVEPVEGMKDGIVTTGGGGDGDRRFDADCVFCASSAMVVCCAVKGLDDGRVEELELESESDSEDEDDDSEDSFEAPDFAINGLIDFGSSSADEDEESEDTDDDEEAARLFLFLLRFLAGALTGPGAMLVMVHCFFLEIESQSGVRIPDLLSASFILRQHEKSSSRCLGYV